MKTLQNHLCGIYDSAHCVYAANVRMSLRNYKKVAKSRLGPIMTPPTVYIHCILYSNILYNDSAYCYIYIMWLFSGQAIVNQPLSPGNFGLYYNLGNILQNSWEIVVCLYT